MSDNLSAGKRRKIIDRIVETETELTRWANPNGLTPEAAPYREWATTRAPTLRAELEAMTDQELLAEKERCRQPFPEFIPEWTTFTWAKLEEEERRHEVERQWQYFRSIAQKGGQRSKKQPDIIEACRDMYARNPKISVRRAYNKLCDTGHEMPGGRVVRFKKKIAYETFRTHYWANKDEH